MRRRFLSPGACLGGALAAVLMLMHGPVFAVLSFTTPTTDPTRQYVSVVTPPAGTGASYIGTWGSFTGIAIGSNYFITAKHLGNQGTFTFQSTSYSVAQIYDDPQSDLRIVRVNGTFSTYAPLYLGGDETGKTATIFGRGTGVTGAARINNDPGNPIQGWKWVNSYGSPVSWGQDVVSGVYDSKYNNVVVNDLLMAVAFSASAGNVALTAGDSGGGMFIQDTDNVWKLAGVSLSVDGPFSTDGTSATQFSGSLFDAGGFYLYDSTAKKYVYIPNQSYDINTESYATRIGARQGWILSIIPEPATLSLLTMAIPLLWRRRG